MQINYQQLKGKYAGLDLYRIACAAAVCLFHTAKQLAADYGFLQPIARMGAVSMTAFFMLSGFSLFVNYAGKNILEKQSLKVFLLKRALGLLPMYYFAAALHTAIRFAMHPSLSMAISEIISLPLEMLCLQTTIPDLAIDNHNATTWFISCIALCYLVYPLLQEVIKQCCLRTKLRMIALCTALLLYAPLVTWRFQATPVYANPFFRLLEFTIGITLASLKAEPGCRCFTEKYLYRTQTVLLALLFMLAGITAAVRLGFFVGNYMLYSWICLPCFAVILLGISGIRFPRLEKAPWLSYCSSVCYVFYLVQLFIDPVFTSVFTHLAIQSNALRILTAWGMCIVLAVVSHELVEKPLTRFLRRKFLS